MFHTTTNTYVERPTPKTPDELAYARWLREREEAKRREEAWASVLAAMAVCTIAGIGFGLFALYGLVYGQVDMPSVFALLRWP